MKTKIVAWKPICQEIFCFNLHGQTFKFCRKSLTLKIDVKYLFTTLDYYFCFYDETEV